MRLCGTVIFHIITQMEDMVFLIWVLISGISFHNFLDKFSNQRHFDFSQSNEITFVFELKNNQNSLKVNLKKKFKFSIFKSNQISFRSVDRVLSTNHCLQIKSAIFCSAKIVSHVIFLDWKWPTLWPHLKANPTFLVFQRLNSLKMSTHSWKAKKMPKTSSKCVYYLVNR